jgi:hypothetical protein
MKLLTKNLVIILFYVILGSFPGNLFGQCADTVGIQPTGQYGTNFCSGSSTGFRISNPVPGQTYQWTRNGSNLSGATGTSISVSDVATYSLIVYRAGCTYYTQSYTTNMWNNLAPTVPNVSGPASPNLTMSVSNPDGVSSYIWFTSGGVYITAAKSYTPTVSVTTSYKVQKGGPCGTSPQTTVTRTVTP